MQLVLRKHSKSWSRNKCMCLPKRCPWAMHVRSGGCTEGWIFLTSLTHRSLELQCRQCSCPFLLSPAGLPGSRVSTGSNVHLPLVSRPAVLPVLEFSHRALLGLFVSPAHLTFQKSSSEMVSGPYTSWASSLAANCIMVPRSAFHCVTNISQACSKNTAHPAC